MAITKELKLKAEGNSLYVFVGGTQVNQKSSVEEIYNKYRDEDNFLYVTYIDVESHGANNSNKTLINY